MPASESAAHLNLKRLALIWAQANRYPIVGCEVALPNLRFRLDVGAYRPGARRVWPAEAASPASAAIDGLPRPRGRRSPPALPTIGTTAVFECKASRADLIRDCRSAERLGERMRVLTERRAHLEALLKVHAPSLRNGDSLWAEYESFDFAQADHAPYRKVVKELATLSRQLHGQTKMESLLKWRAANLHYLVVEPELLQRHEVPAGWGLLVRAGERLTLAIRPEWHEVGEATQLSFLHRVAAAGSKAVNRQGAVSYADIELERRGLDPAMQASLAEAVREPEG